MTLHLLPPCEADDNCVCDEHPESCDTCEDLGYIEVLIGTSAVDIPCPDCPRGDAA